MKCPALVLILLLTAASAFAQTEGARISGRVTDQTDAVIAGAKCTITNLETNISNRLIPSWVKLEVWKRDQGRCQKCGTTSGLHFDHIIPYSKGGSSKDPANIQILCGSHNLSKRDNIE